MRSPRSSLVTMRTRDPRAPTQAPTGSTLGSFGPHGDLGPVARLAGRRPDLDHARGDLGDLQLEQALDQARVAAADHDLGALGGLADLHDVGLQAGPVLVALVGDLLGLGQQGLDLAQVEQGVAVVGLLDDAGDDVALAPGVLLVLEVALGLADALEDDLLGRLGGDAAEVVGRVVPLPDDVAVLVELLAVDADLARLGVDGDDGLLGRTRASLVGGHQRVGQGVEKGLDGDALVARDLAQGVEEFEVGLAHGVVTFFPVGFPPRRAADRAARSATARPGRAAAGDCDPHSKTVRARSTSS